MFKTQQEWKCFSLSFMWKVCTAAKKKKKPQEKKKSSKQTAAKRDIYLRLLQHERSPWRVFCMHFSQSVWTALNKRERLKSSTTTIYPSGLTRKSLKYVCWRTSNNCRVNAVIYHHPPLPFLFFLLFPLMVSGALPVCILFAHWFSSTLV